MRGSWWTMGVFFVRQPIYTSDRALYAYEMIYRKGASKEYTFNPQEEKSAKQMFDLFQNYGIENLTSNKPAFINFTSKLIKEEIATSFSKRELIVQIFKGIKLDQEVLQKCIALKQRGYKLAMDNLVYQKGNKPLAKIADIIKIDFKNTEKSEIEAMISELKSYNIKFLAENLEDCDEFDYAKSLGCVLFQGFFCQKAEIMACQKIDSVKVSYLQIMNEVNKADLNFDELAELLSQDLDLTQNLLKMVNSAGFAFKSITSVKQALILLGTEELKKCINLVVLRELGGGKSEETIKESLIRAKFCESIAAKTYAKDQAANLFLVGLFSLIDTILHKPLEEILNKIEPTQEVREALLNQSGKYGAILKIVSHYERGLLDEITAEKNTLQINDDELMELYIRSLLWYNTLSQGASE